MSAEVVTGFFCADYFSDFLVPGSKPGTSHRVSLGGLSAHCSCPAFQFFRGPEMERTCKHIAYVWEHACLWNEQWCEGKADDLDPVAGSCDYPTVQGESCPHCGGPVCPVKIAV